MKRFFALNLLAATIMLTTSGCSESKSKHTVKKMDIIESVYSSVSVEPKSLYVVNSSNSGYIDEMFIQTGTEVTTDMVLFAVRDVASNANADNAHLQYEAARRNYEGSMSLIEDIKLEVSDAQFKRKNDSINFQRTKTLYGKGLATKIEYEQAETLFNASKTRHELAKNKITRSKKDLQGLLSQAQNTYYSSLSRAGDALVRSKIDGMVYDVLKESGEFVSMQEPVAILGSKKEFIIKMRVDEVDITKIQLGQTIEVALEAYKEQTFKAHVTRISPKMETQTQTFKVEGQFIDIPESLYMGLTGEGNIVIAERKTAVVIPLEYLINDNYVQTESGKKKVTVGVKSLSHAEIISGLKDGTVIIKPEE